MSIVGVVTAVLAEKAGAVVVRHPRNLGQGEGLHADGQHDPAQLPDLVGPVVAGESGYVQGSRHAGTSHKPGGIRYPLGFLAVILRSVVRARLRRRGGRTT